MKSNKQTFSQKCPCIRIMIQNFLTLHRKRLVLTFLVKFIMVELLNHKSIKTCRFCHLLPAILIQLLYHMQNDGLAIWENKFPPLRGGGKRQRKHMRSTCWLESSLLWAAGSWDPPQHPTRPNRTAKAYSNQKETQKSALKKGKKPETIGSQMGKFVSGAEFL